MSLASTYVPLIIPGLAMLFDARTTPLGAVAQWNDLSGFNNHFTQGAGSAQPVNTANRINGQNALIFNSASSQCLVGPASSYGAFSGDTTIFSVAKGSASGSQERIISGGNSGVNRWNLSVLDLTDMYFQSRTANGSGVQATYPAQTWAITSAFKSGTTQSITVNNGTPVTNSNGINTSVNQTAIGANGSASSFFFGGEIAYLAIYNRALSAPEITQVQQYLANNYGL